MKVKLSRNVQIETTVHMAGSEVQVSDELGKELLGAGYAEELKAPKGEAKTETKTDKK